MAWKRVTFLETGDSYYGAVLTAIAGARRSVLIEKYIFRFDNTGKTILHALSEARQRGVRVFLRVDGIGSRDAFPALGEYCRSQGIELEVFHPLPFASVATRRFRSLIGLSSFLLRWRALNRRSHRKLVIVDERLAFAGGRNVDDVESEARAGAEAWHDLSVKLEGTGIRRLVQAFWLWPFRRQPTRDFLLNYNWRLRLTRNAWFHRRLQGAQKRFWVVTPYFAPTPTILFQLRMAARRGVDIRLVLPSKIDVPLSALAARALYHRLLHWGVRVFEFQPRILHRKLWVMDEFCVVGSGNLNHRSFMHDLEIDMVFHEPTEVDQGHELFLKDQAQCREIRLADLEVLSPWQRMVYWLASWLVYWL